MSIPDKGVLFVCVEDSNRSVVAEAFAESLGLDASSAGTSTSTRVDPLVVVAIEWSGEIDVSQGRPEHESADIAYLRQWP